MLDRIEDILSGMRPAERRIADVILANPGEAIQLSMACIADRASVSEPSIVRFCRLTGCSGYREFKIKLAQELATREFTGDLELDASDRAALGSIQSRLNFTSEQLAIV